MEDRRSNHLQGGRRSYFRYNTLDLNPVGASDIAKDKDYAAFFMAAMGYPVVPGSRASTQIDGLRRFARPVATSTLHIAMRNDLGFRSLSNPTAEARGRSDAGSHSP